MATLQELTLDHSRRLSELYRTRDVRLAEAQATRDLQLRAVPAAAKAFQKYDDELASARERQLGTQGKAEVARASAHIVAADRRGDRFEDAQSARRSTDVDVIQSRRRGEEAAEAKYRSASERAREGPEASRAQALQDADRARRSELDQAKRTHDEKLSSSQQTYRDAVENAVTTERRDNRDSERAYFDALRLGDAANDAARTAADHNLLASLSVISEAREIMRRWYQHVALIRVETAKAEQEEFARFRRELETVRG